MKITNHKLCQFIVKKYIKNNINWAKEIKMAQALTKTYKDYYFWNSLKELKLPSLAWFFTDDGKNFLKLHIKIQNLSIQNQKSYNINSGKIGEDKKTCQKPKNLLEFITYGKKT